MPLWKKTGTWLQCRAIAKLVASMWDSWAICPVSVHAVRLILHTDSEGLPVSMSNLWLVPTINLEVINCGPWPLIQIGMVSVIPVRVYGSMWHCVPIVNYFLYNIVQTSILSWYHYFIVSVVTVKAFFIALTDYQIFYCLYKISTNLYYF